eukprot:3769950-Pyramimonas_sp.AAC.1
METLTTLPGGAAGAEQPGGFQPAGGGGRGHPPRAAGARPTFPCRTNQMQEAWVYSHDGPIRCRKR